MVRPAVLRRTGPCIDDPDNAVAMVFVVVFLKPLVRR
jgi:hypothetical protein